MNLIKKQLILTLLTLLFTINVYGNKSYSNSDIHNKILNKDVSKLSVSLFSSKPEEGDAMVNINSQLGKFLSSDLEVLVDTSIFTISGNTTYRLGTGVNYYFLTGTKYKNQYESLTPYVGAGIGYHKGGDFDDRVYVGAHYFLNQDTAISPEAGFQFIDFVDYQQTYFNVFLTFFFDDLFL